MCHVIMVVIVEASQLRGVFMGSILAAVTSFLLVYIFLVELGTDKSKLNGGHALAMLRTKGNA